MEKINKNETDEFMKEGYPIIPDRLIDCLRKDFPDRLPRKYIDSYELGVLAGQQQVIDKLLSEKEYIEADLNSNFNTKLSD